MDLFEKIEKLHNKENHQAIIELIESQEENIDCKLNSLLSRAYANNKDYYKAYQLLLECEDELSDDGDWNFRIGYNLYYLDREYEAIKYLEKSNEIDGELKIKNDIDELIKSCYEISSLPIQTKTFISRADEFWEEFLKYENELLGLLSEENISKNKFQAIEFLYSIVSNHFNNLGVEIGMFKLELEDGEKHEIVLSPEGMNYRYIQINKLLSRMPERAKEKWIFNIGRQSHEFNMKINGIELSIENLEISYKISDEGLELILYNSELSKLLKDDEMNAYYLAYIYTDNLFGEVFCMRNIKSLVLAEKKEEGLEYHLIGDVYKDIISKVNENQEQSDDDYMLSVYRPYSFEPINENQDLRSDIIAGYTIFSDLISEYETEEYDVMNELQSNGIISGFIFYDNTKFDSESVITSRSKFEDALSNEIQETGILLGGATGTQYSYIDFMAFNFYDFLQKAEKVAKKLEFEDTQVSVFRKNTEIYNLVGSDEEVAVGELRTYDEKEWDVLENHIETCFGHVEEVFHEIVSDDLHIDLYIVEPTEDRNYYTIITNGMGAYSMNIPDELKEMNIHRTELAISLPATWDIKSEKERWYWPLRWLKILARLPITDDTWLGYGHTIENSGSFSDYDNFGGLMILPPYLFDSKSASCTLPNGDDVNYYSVIPIYKDEMAFKKEEGADELVELFERNNLSMEDIFVVNPKRKNCAKNL